MPQSVPDGVLAFRTEPGATGDGAASDSALDVQYARDVIAGRVPPRPLPVPAEVEEAVKRVLPDREAPKWVRDDFTLQYHFGGHAVATFQASKTSELTVLAVTEPVIGRLLKALTPEEVDRLLIQFPSRWWRKPTDAASA